MCIRDSSSFRYHLTAAKNNGITRTEIAEILTHAAFYAGWPKAWAACRMAKEVWAEDAAEDAKAKHQSEMVLPSVHPTTVLHNISAEKAIWPPCPPHRLAFTTSPLRRHRQPAPCHPGRLPHPHQLPRDSDHRWPVPHLAEKP